MDDQQKPSLLKSFMQDLLIGGSAGAISKTVCAPLERVKLLIQTAEDNPALRKRPYKGMTDCFMRCVREEGPMSLWRGNSSNVIRYFPTTAIGFACKDYLAKTLIVHKKNENYFMFFIEKLASGGFAGLISLTFVFPLDFARTRLAADVSDKTTKRKFNGLSDCFMKIYKKNGISGLYQGFGCSALGIFVYRSFYFGLYDLGKEYQGPEASFLQKFVMAQAVVTFSETLTYPIDTVRRRMMMQSGRPQKEWIYKNARQAFGKILKEEGVPAYFQGVTSNIIRSVASSLVLVLYDKFKDVMGISGAGGH